MMNRAFAFLIFAGLLIAFFALPAAAFQSTDVTAEAIGEANLRATPDVNAELVGHITSGTRYAVIGRSEFYPWVLIADEDSLQPLGWVFADLVTIRGDINQVEFSKAQVDGSATLAAPSMTPADAAATLPVSPTPPAPVTEAVEAPTLSAAVVGVALGEINVRYGPGVDYPAIGLAHEGDQFEISAAHTQLPWLQVKDSASPNGYGWIARDLLDVTGDLNSLNDISQMTFFLPTLTPTPSMIESSGLLGGTAVPLSPAFKSLGDQVWQLLLDKQFVPGSSRLGALFLMDLKTGQALTFDNRIAFSGMSLNKIAILAALFSKLNGPPDGEEANIIAESLICSDNGSTNKLLGIIGDGDPWAGARYVTRFMQRLGLEDTFIAAPYGPDPRITPEPVSAPVTDADQKSAEPDLYNQATVSDLGQLLGSMYQCAYADSGPLLSPDFASEYTPRECKMMLHIMSYNKIGAMFEGGVPTNTRIAHKHGWIDDTHGDAGIIFTPGGDFALVVIVHNPTWVDSSESFPLISEVARSVYNYYNPNAPEGQVNEAVSAEQCQILGNPLIQDMVNDNDVP